MSLMERMAVRHPNQYNNVVRALSKKWVDPRLEVAAHSFRFLYVHTRSPCQDAPVHTRP